MKSTSSNSYLAILSVLALTSSALPQSSHPQPCGQGPPVAVNYFTPANSAKDVCTSPDSGLRYDTSISKRAIPLEAYERVREHLVEVTDKFLADNSPGPGRDNIYSSSACQLIHPPKPGDKPDIKSCERSVCINFASATVGEGDNERGIFHHVQEQEVLKFLKPFDGPEKGNGKVEGTMYESTILVKDQKGKALANVCVQLDPVCGSGKPAECLPPKSPNAVA